MRDLESDALPVLSELPRGERILVPYQNATCRLPDGLITALTIYRVEVCDC
jgi:hypothetical protein